MIFCILSMASVTRLDSSGSGSPINSPEGLRKRRGVFASSLNHHCPKICKTRPESRGGSPVRCTIAADRPAFLSQFLSDFFNLDQLRGKLISDQAIQLNWTVAAGASPEGTLDCVTAFSSTDFRNDLKHIDVPTLVIHATANRIVPFARGGACRNL